jgi:hypothetical protein
MGYYQ